jgi:hypothetical protein
MRDGGIHPGSRPQLRDLRSRGRPKDGRRGER